MNTLERFFKKNGFVGSITILVIGLAILVIIINKVFTNKNGRFNGMEKYGPNQNNAYNNPSSKNSIKRPSFIPSQPLNQNNSFGSINGMKTTQNFPVSGNSKTKPQNPNDLLPRDKNSEWAKLNPSGKGELSNINLLKAGYHIGIDTVGQTLRNANLQIRSEPPNPQLNVGPWNQSTITPDFMRPPLEIGIGTQ